MAAHLATPRREGGSTARGPRARRHARVFGIAAVVAAGFFLTAFLGANPVVRWVTVKAGGHPQAHPWSPHLVLVFAGFAAFCGALGVIRMAYDIR